MESFALNKNSNFNDIATVIEDTQNKNLLIIGDTQKE